MARLPQKCHKCRERAVTYDVIPEYSCEMVHDARPYTVNITNFDVLKCKNCGEITFDEKATTQLSDALRTTVGVLHPAEIRAARESLGLSQKELASRIRVSETSLCRWETGAQIQQRSLDLLLRLYFRMPEVQKFIAREAIDLALKSKRDFIQLSESFRVPTPERNQSTTTDSESYSFKPTPVGIVGNQSILKLVS